MSPGKLDQLAAAVAAGQTVAEAAGAVGISARTAYRAAAEPAFKSTVDDLRRQSVSETIGKLTAAATAATQTLTELLGKRTPPTVRLGAARAILASLIDVQTHAELTARIAELERVIVNYAQQPGGAGQRPYGDGN
jgi:hypothetical protein